MFAVRGSMAPGIAGGLTYQIDTFQNPPTAQKLQFVRSLFKLSKLESCTLLGHYIATGGNVSPTFRDILSVPSSGISNPKGFVFSIGTFKGAVLQIGRSLVRSQLVSLEFFTDIKSFRSRYGPEVDSASNRNEYQEHFLGVKAAGA